MLDDSMRYEILRLLEAQPDLSQREIAQRIGVSLGKANYCLKALIDKGWVKIQNFRSSRNKSAYIYKLTPSGVAEKVKVTQRFLERRLKEHDEILAEIEQLRQEVQKQGEA